MKKCILLAGIFLLGISLYLKSQTITIDSTFTSDGEIFPFSQVDSIYGLSLSGHVTLNSDTSLVRVILVDENYDEYMVYEAYPLITTSLDFDITNVSDETKYLNKTEPYSVMIYLEDAELEFSALICQSYMVESADSLQSLFKTSQELQKVAYINDYIEDNQMIWFADTNNISNLTFAIKKRMFGEKYNLKGFEYYVGGIYDITLNGDIPVYNSTLVDEFSWRKRHNANRTPVPGNPYYDGIDGWLTPVKLQLCSDCWVFAPLHQTEALVNLYFNQQLNMDLSEQELASCVDTDHHCDEGGDIGSSLIYLRSHGVVNEQCFPYPYYEDLPPDAVNVPCALNCEYPEERIRIDGFRSLSVAGDDGEEKLKKALIEYGPLSVDVLEWTHYIVFIGFGKVRDGDTIFIDILGAGNYKIINEETGVGAEYIGKTFWICKNSWGSSMTGSDHGYIKMFCPTNRMSPPKYIKTPIHSENLDENDIECIDWDKDGYYNWGILNTKPATCPECHDSIDSNDDNPRIGPYDKNYYGTPVTPVMVLTDNDNKIIPDENYYMFYDPQMVLGETDTLTFKIKNEGNAQLNLQSFNTIIKSGISAANFEITDFPETTIGMEGYTTFDIEFTLKDPVNEPKIAVFTINLDEPDMETYSFALVFSDCTYDPVPEVLHYDTEWNGWDMRFKDVYVESGVTLTVNGSMAFADQAGLYIMQGGRVYIDGGLLTNLCDDLWQGVDVWGNARQTQNVQSNQGIIKLENGGRIEYADVGIETIRYVSGEPDFDKTGGIVMINEGSIENCPIGVHLFPYDNIHPITHELMPNLSYFTKAEFSTNEVLYKMSLDPERQLWLEEVDGIRITGSNFENNFIPELQQNEERGTGIYSFLSSFFISNYDPYPAPGEISRSTFSKLEYGIKALSERTAQLMRVDSAYFEDNLRGIYLSLCENNAELIRNDFLVRDNESVWSTNYMPVGIYTDYFTTGFTIEENRFYTSIDKENLETNKCLGIVINNSGQDPNEIFNNNFHNLLLGIAAQGENRSETGEGLCIKCNDFVDCITDVYVAPRYDGNGNPVSGPTIGIAEQQGIPNGPGGSDPTLAAGNTFSDDNTEANYYNDINCEYVTYTHHDNNNPPKKIRPNPVVNIDRQEDNYASYSKETSCPSNLPGGGAIDESLEKSSLSAEYIAVSAYEDTLGNFTDGGDTEALNADVQSSFPDEAMEVRQQLLNESPYLSDTVMKSAIDKEDVLPNAMVRDILVANPQSAKAPDVINTLDNRFDPMPDYMMGEIMAGLNTTGAKELLEQQLALHKTKRGKSLLKLERFYKNDTLNPAASNDSLVALWQREPYPGAWYKLSFHYLNKSDSAGLFQTLDSIPVNFNLSLKEEQLHEQYEDLFDILWTLQADSINPDSTMTQTLLSLANHKSIPGVYAMNRLIHDSVIIYQEPVYLPDLLKSAPVYPENPNKEEKVYILNIFPNPAGDYFIIEYDLSEYKKSSFILVYDATGRKYKQIDLENTQTQKVVSTNGFSYGTYFLQLHIGRELKEVVKLTITK